MKSQEKLFQVGVKALIENSRGEILVLDSGDWHFKHHKRHWDIPGGRIKEGHSALPTLHREIEEETGVKEISDVEFLTAVVSNFEFQAQGHKVGLVLMVYKAQIPVNSKIILSKEHSDYKWLSKEEAAKLLAYKYPKEFTETLVK